MTPAEILEGAATVIETHGLAQGVLALDDYGKEVRPLDPRASRFCGEGAMRKACGIDVVMTLEVPELYAAYKAMCDHVRTLMPKRLHAIVADWNDLDETTADDVVRELRACAANLRAKEATNGS